MMKQVVKMSCFYVFYVPEAVADPGGTAGMRPTPQRGSISFIFAYVFAKKCTCWRSATPQWVGAPPTGNPGSATAKENLFYKCFV